MRIGFDISDLATGRADGTTRYTYELAKRLPELAPEHEWLFFSPGPIHPSYQLPATGPQVITSPWPKYWTQSRLPFDLFKYQPDVLFMPIQQLPYLRPRKMKTVAVMHDLAFHEFGQQYTAKDWALQHIFAPYAAREANELICVSQATADDVAKYYGREQNVRVVHHGVNHEVFRGASDQEPVTSWQKLREAYPKLEQPFILYVGQLQPRKNLTGLIEAFEELTGKGNPPLSGLSSDKQEIPHPQPLSLERRGELNLVVAGSHGWLQKPILERIENSPARNSIQLLGRVPDELLPMLYQNAEVFVLPSFYEGFGMPILEAMASGCPVVTSNVSCMPEVARQSGGQAGSAAVLVDPYDTQSIANGIRQALHNKDELRAKGLRRAKEFSWDVTANQTLEVLTQAIENQVQ